MSGALLVRMGDDAMASLAAYFGSGLCSPLRTSIGRKGTTEYAGGDVLMTGA